MSRKLIESEIWDKPPLYLKVWMYLLMRAQFKPYKNLERGELVVSIPELIEACSYKVGYRTEKPTKSQIFNILEWLRNSDEASHEGYANDTMIETTKTTRGMVVKVLNYNVYQDSKNYEHNAEQNDEKPTNDTMPKRQADTINKNDKNELRTKESSPTTTDEFSGVARMFEANICMLSPMQYESFEMWFNDFGGNAEILEEAIRTAADRNKKSYGFTEYLLKEWANNKLTTLDQVRSHERNKFGNKVHKFEPQQLKKDEHKYDYGF